VAAADTSQSRLGFSLGPDHISFEVDETVYPLEAGNGLRLTTALYYTPGNRSIQEVGIAPDIVVQAPERLAEAEAGEEGESPDRVRERDLERHFTQEDAIPAPAPGAGEGKGKGGGSGGATGYPDDVQLGRAVEVLKSWTYFERLRNGAGESVQAKAPAPEKAP